VCGNQTITLFEKEKKPGYISTLSWTPGLPTCVMAIELIWTPSIQN